MKAAPKVDQLACLWADNWACAWAERWGQHWVVRWDATTAALKAEHSVECLGATKAVKLVQMMADLMV